MSMKSKMAFKFSMDELADKAGTPHVFLWTFTFREVLDVTEAKKRWSSFLKHPTRGLVPAFPQMSGIRVFEMHPGGKEGLSHGLHIHAVVDCFLPVDIVRLKWHRFAGEGSRLHVKQVPKEAAHYIGKYLNKKRDVCLGSARLWASFGKSDATRCKDIVVESEFMTAYRFIKAAIRGFTDLPWHTRMHVTNHFMRGSSIEWAFQQAGLIDDQYEQSKAERDYFASLNDSAKVSNVSVDGTSSTKAKII